MIGYFHTFPVFCRNPCQLTPGSREAGLTLVEVMVALALFALIGMAGLALLDSVGRVQRGTDLRLERLGALQRALHVATLDVETALAETVTPAPGGGVRLRRAGGLTLEYARRDGALVRRLSAPGRAPVDQILVGDVAALDVSYHAPGGAWHATWPPPGSPPAPGAPATPDALALELTLTGPAPNGRLRRVVHLVATAP